MKHLKKYSQSESVLRHYNESNNEDILSDIKDILLELQDEGFIMEYRFTKNNNYFISLIRSTTILIRKFNKTFKYDEVSEVIERLKDFMESEGYYTRIQKSRTLSGNNYGVNITFTEINKNHEAS